MPEHADRTSSYHLLDTVDTTGNKQEFYAAYRNEQFTLFKLEGGVASVWYLLPAQNADDIARVVTERIINVNAQTPLPQRPAITEVKFLSSRQWTEMEKGIVGVILETGTSP